MTTSTYRTPLLAAFAIVAAVPLAFAQGGAGGGAGKGGGPAQMFLFFDEDGDGRISRSEFEAAGAQRFAEADTNKDGSLTMEEFRASRTAQGARVQQMFVYLDADGNGVIDAEEFEIHAGTRFETLDKNGDGYLSQEELAAISRARSGGQGGGPGKDGGGPGPGR
jgi:hypothetical protein